MLEIYQISRRVSKIATWEEIQQGNVNLQDHGNNIGTTLSELRPFFFTSNRCFRIFINMFLRILISDS